MPEAAAPLGPLAHAQGEFFAGLSERPFTGQVNLRGDAADARFLAAVRAATGLEPPTVPNTVAGDGALRLLWLGPDEWLLLTPPGEAAARHAALEAALEGQHAGAIDLTHAGTLLVLEGPDAADILASECPLDLDPAVFPPGACAQTVFAKSNVLLLREAEARFAILVRRSFAGYLLTALRHAALLARAGG